MLCSSPTRGNCIFGAIDKIKTTSPQVVEALIWIAILTMLVSQRLHHVIRRSAPEKHVARYTKLKWATVFAENAVKLLEAILKFLGITMTLELIPDVYTSGTVDPHVSRKPLTSDLWS